MENHHGPFYPVLVVAFAGVFVVVSFLLLTPRFIGHVTVSGVGGQMTMLNLEVPTGALSWMGVYGNLTTNSTNTTFGLVGGQVISLNLSYGQAFTNETVIVASLNSSPDWLNLSPASHAEVNAFLGVAPADAMSGENTLWELENFTVNDVVYELWSATVSSTNGTYRTGAFISHGSLLFVTRPVVNGSGFDGSLVDFQIILPIPPGGSINYTFFVFEQSLYPGEITTVTCNESINLTSVLAADNQSVVVVWDGLFGATSYEVMYVDGPTNGHLNFSNASFLSTGLLTNWTDGAPGNERYYRVRINDSNSSCVAQETAGTLAQPLTTGYNLVSTPFFGNNDSVKETLRSIGGDYSEAIVYDNVAKQFRFYLVVGNNVFKNYDEVIPGKGYWIRTSSNVSLRFVGSMAKNMSELLSPEYNLVGFPVISNADHNDTVAYVLSSINGNYSEAIVYDNVAKQFRFYLVVGNNVFKNYDQIVQGKGYWIRTSVNETLEYVFTE